MNTIKHWFMKHFYQDIYNLYRLLDAQKEINSLLMKKLDDLNERIFYLESNAIKGLTEKDTVNFTIHAKNIEEFTK